MQGGSGGGARRPRALTFPGQGQAEDRQECLLEKEMQRPGEKLGGDVRDRDPADGECENSAWFYFHKQRREGGRLAPRF